MSAAWQRSEGKNPKGGLNAKGRASYKAETGGTLKPPVKSGDNPRRASFLARMGNMAGPMEKDGKPTRLALAYGLGVRRAKKTPKPRLERSVRATKVKSNG